MFYEAELLMLRETFRKCRIQTHIAELQKPLFEQQESTIHAFMKAQLDMSQPLSAYVPTVLPETIYRMRDPFDCRYTFLRLPEAAQEVILIIGPYLPALPARARILEWAEHNNVSPAQLKLLESYYNNVPILPDTSHLFALIDAFAERIWGPCGITVEDIDQDVTPVIPMLIKKASSEDEETLLDMKTMELRYQYENDMMEAVAKGQVHKADLLMTNFTTFSFEQRVADPVRNAKNYCIIMNTLLRKAAERGGVHPMYIDKTSSSIALRIEQVHSLEAIPPLMTDMFRDYCRLVRQHSMKNYSPPVQKALLYIDGNLTDNLSLRTVSETLNVSASYLSSLFRKETGTTLTEYITRRRVRHAMHLLKNTRLQIQTVAQHCGILDVQYFSKVFKRVAGMTPKEYRDSLQH